MQRGLGFGLTLGLAACVAPRAVTQTGRVAPQGEFRGGADMVYNIPTGTTSAFLDGLDNTVDNLAQKNDNLYEQGMNDAAKAAVAYSLDPVSMGTAFWLRYGVIERVDAGYKYASGAHVFDARFQFLGAPGSRTKDGTNTGLAGSIGAQYSQQSYELPGFAGIDKLGKLFGFHMDRKDVLVPLILSVPFGPEEKYGAFSFGAVGGYTWLDYGLEPHDIVKDVGGVQEVVEKVSRKQGFATYGGFFNIKGGYKYAYLGLGLAAYYQEYGSFDILDKVSFKIDGFTFVPTISFELRY
jgi:hypothetical protein